MAVDVMVVVVVDVGVAVDEGVAADAGLDESSKGTRRRTVSPRTVTKIGQHDRSHR